MQHTKIVRPLVPGGSRTDSQGDGWKRQPSKGAKNHRVRPGHQRRQKLQIATYNTRTLSTDEKILEMEEELSRIHWDIVGISEVRRKGEDQISLKSGNTFYFRGNQENSMGGVGFIVHQRHAKNIQFFESISSRVCLVVLKLNQRYKIKIIQAYAPTSTHPDEEVESFYEDISLALTKTSTQFTLVVGDFNAKLGKKQDETEFALGRNGTGERNERGDTLLRFLLQHNLYAMNTFFKKAEHRKWTWQSPDGRARNEIDIITDKKQIIQDVSVLNNLSVGSDHRMVRTKVMLNIKKERRSLTRTNHILWTAVESKEEYQRDIAENLGDTSSMSIEVLNNTIQTSVHEAQKKHCSKQRDKEERLSRDTRNMINQRRELLQHHTDNQAELRVLNKKISKAIRKDIRQFNTRWVSKVIEENKSMKVLRRKLATGRTEITKVENSEGDVIRDREEILKVVEEFYSKLYSADDQPERNYKIPHILNQGSEDMLEITKEEVEKSMSEMKDNKAPGGDELVVEAMKEGGPYLLEAITRLFNKCLMESTTPEAWNNAVIIIMHKKGNIADLKNYRPISLLSHLYKLFTKILTRRLTPKLDLYQPVEQAGFRSGYGTNDHLMVIKTLIEKSVEYNKPLLLVFVDYEKAFDSIKHESMLKALADCRIDYRYSALIRNIYKNATASVRLHDETGRFRIGRGVRQGDTISPRLFTTLMQFMFKNVRLEDTGVNINGEYLTHLRFADDIVLVSDSLIKAETQLKELIMASERVGLKINASKTQFMTNLVTNRNIVIEGSQISQVTSYKYLGHEIRIGRDNQTCEIERRIGLTWAAFGKLKHVFKSDIPICLKRKVFDQCVLPVLTYGCETLTLTKKSINRVRVTQRAMERSILGITLRDRVTNDEIRRRTGVTDAIRRITYLKWNWAGHVARMSGERWTKKIMEWRPRQDALRNRGRPITRWTDDIKRITTNWLQSAQDRNRWKSLREAYVQQWTMQAV